MALNTKQVLVCPDTFKGTLSSLGVTETVRNALMKSQSKFNVDIAPMSDGGAGLLDSLLHGCKGLEPVKLTKIVGPLGLGHRVECRFALHREQRYAVVEMAEASGLPLVDARLNVLNAARGAGQPPLEKDPRKTTSYGTGEVMMHIAEAFPAAEVEKVYIGIGGSSTNDLGLGALQALGLDIYVREGDEPERRLEEPFTGGMLGAITRLDADTEKLRAFRRRFPGTAVILLCDVINPLLGPHGATMIYGPQKGAKGNAPRVILNELEEGMKNAAEKINELLLAKNSAVRDIGKMRGAGGAGGMSGGFFAVLDAQWKSGAEILQNVFLELNRRLAAADVIVTGEGRFDTQTIQYGKTVASIYKALLAEAKAAKAKNNKMKEKIFIVVCGLYEGPPFSGRSLIPSLSVDGLIKTHAFALAPKRFTKTDAMTRTATSLAMMMKHEVVPFIEAETKTLSHL